MFSEWYQLFSGCSQGPLCLFLSGLPDKEKLSQKYVGRFVFIVFLDSRIYLDFGLAKLFSMLNA